MADVHRYNNDSLGLRGNLIKVTSQACVHTLDIYTYIYLYTTQIAKSDQLCFADKL